MIWQAVSAVLKQESNAQVFWQTVSAKFPGKWNKTACIAAMTERLHHPSHHQTAQRIGFPKAGYRIQPDPLRFVRILSVNPIILFWEFPGFISTSDILRDTKHPQRTNMIFFCSTPSSLFICTKYGPEATALPNLSHPFQTTCRSPSSKT